MERKFIDGYSELQTNPEIVGVNKLPYHSTLERQRLAIDMNPHAVSF